jgi:hypothetical protein
MMLRAAGSTMSGVEDGDRSNVANRACTDITGRGELFYDELKKLPIGGMEEAIGKAISELAGAEFLCTISNIDLSQIEGVQLDIFLSPPKDFDLTDEPTEG